VKSSFYNLTTRAHQNLKIRGETRATMDICRRSGNPPRNKKIVVWLIIVEVQIHHSLSIRVPKLILWFLKFRN